MVNADTFKSLIQSYAEDKEMLDIINSAVISFIDYFHAIFDSELYSRIYSYKSIEKEEFKTRVMELDKNRTVHHNAVLANVKLLNRLAEMNHLEPFYDGVVSEERPYRREVANAVIQFVEMIIAQRN